MARIVKPAVEIRQGGRTLFFTSFSVAEFAATDFYRVDELDAKDEAGFQRVLEKRRAKLLASDMAKARAEGKAFLPTSIFLATGAALEYNPDRREVSFDSEPGPGRVCPFAVVDGQHRIEGMRMAAEKEPSLSAFPMAVVIAAELGDLEQMLHFYLVNTTQKSVDKSIEQQIKAKLRRMEDIGERVFLPDRILKEVRRGRDRDALDVVRALNNHPESPWYGRVVMANEDSGPRSTIRQSTFVRSVREFLLVRGHKLSSAGLPADTRDAMLRNYWRAVSDMFVSDAKKSVVFRHNGTVFFHTVSQPMFNWLAASGDYRVEAVKQRFRLAIEELPDEHYELSRIQWWERGGPASHMNKSEMGRQAGAMMQAVMKARKTERGEDKV